jgi:hypothetical protein
MRLILWFIHNDSYLITNFGKVEKKLQKKLYFFGEHKKNNNI